MVATHNAEMAAAIGKFPLFNILDPGAEDADRNIVFLFAGYRAGMAADAAVVVNYKAVAQTLLPAAVPLSGGQRLLLQGNLVMAARFPPGAPVWRDNLR
jgi:hypothetical protein